MSMLMEAAVYTWFKQIAKGQEEAWKEEIARGQKEAWKEEIARGQEEAWKEEILKEIKEEIEMKDSEIVVTVTTNKKGPKLGWTTAIREYNHSFDFDSGDAASDFIDDLADYLHDQYADYELSKENTKDNIFVDYSPGYKCQKIIDFMKMKNKRIIEYQLSNDMEIRVYFNKKDEQAIKDMEKDDINNIYERIGTSIAAGRHGLNGELCPFCIVHEDKCTICSYKKNHNDISCRDTDNDYNRINSYLGIIDLLSKEVYKQWWEDYHKL